SSTDRAPLVPETIRLLGDEFPTIAVIAIASAGAAVSSVNTPRELVLGWPAASLNCAVSALLPVLRVTGLLVLQLPSSWTSAVPTAAAPSKMVTVAPALASARST